jgi:hypothetical protein
MKDVTVVHQGGTNAMRVKVRGGLGVDFSRVGRRVDEDRGGGRCLPSLQLQVMKQAHD